MEIIADGDNTDVVVFDTQALHEIRLCAVADQAVCHVGEHGIHSVLTNVNGHYLVSQFRQFFGTVASETSKSDDQYIFH